MSNFNHLINGNKPVLVDFYATWCGPCRTQAPILEEVKKRVGERASIIKIDVDQNPQVAAQYQISGIPTLLLFKNGKIIWRKSGVSAAAELERVLVANAE